MIGLFTNTSISRQAILKGILPASADWVFNKRPPAEWVRAWRARGIAVPALERYTDVLVFESGLHILCGTTYCQAYQQYRDHSFDLVLVIGDVSREARAFLRDLTPSRFVIQVEEISDEIVESAPTFEEAIADLIRNVQLLRQAWESAESKRAAKVEAR